MCRARRRCFEAEAVFRRSAFRQLSSSHLSAWAASCRSHSVQGTCNPDCVLCFVFCILHFVFCICSLLRPLFRKQLFDNWAAYCCCLTCNSSAGNLQFKVAISFLLQKCYSRRNFTSKTASESWCSLIHWIRFWLLLCTRAVNIFWLHCFYFTTLRHLVIWRTCFMQLTYARWYTGISQKSSSISSMRHSCSILSFPCLFMALHSTAHQLHVFASCNLWNLTVGLLERYYCHHGHFTLAIFAFISDTMIVMRRI